MAAARNPIWELTDTETKDLAKAIQLFQREFDVPVSDRAVAVSALGTALWFVYGTRISALMMEAQARRKQAQNPPPQQVGPLKFRHGNAAASQPPPEQPAPAPTRADVVQPGEGYVNGAASYQTNGATPPPQAPAGQQPATLIDPVELARAIANPIPPGKPN